MQVITRKEAQDLQLKWYFTGKPCKRGHVADRQTANGRCRECAALTNAANCRRWYEETGSEQVKKRAAEWVKQNPEKRKEVTRAFAARWRMTPAYDEWLEARKTPEGRAKRAAYSRKKRATDPQTAFKDRLRRRVYMAIRAQNAPKAFKTMEVLGCSVRDACAHLERQFTEGMTWENMGEWHIDHIVPCASFDLTDPEQQRICFHYTNLQPLWAEENRKKSDKLAA